MTKARSPSGSPWVLGPRSDARPCCVCVQRAWGGLGNRACLEMGPHYPHCCNAPRLVAKGVVSGMTVLCNSQLMGNTALWPCLASGLWAETADFGRFGADPVQF